MSQTPASLRRKIAMARDLESVVHTMKAMAAAGISQYEEAVHALEDYNRTVQLGLLACFRQLRTEARALHQAAMAERMGVVVFGSDQGLVGEFNDQLHAFVMAALQSMAGDKVIWSVGERMHARFVDSGFQMADRLSLPSSIQGVTALIGQLLKEVEDWRTRGKISELYLFHHQPVSGGRYEPVGQRLLPLDATWQAEISQQHWPSHHLPEIVSGRVPDTDLEQGTGQVEEQTLAAFIREYFFVSMFRACAESLASENASRLLAMQRAEKNIGELLENLEGVFHRLRQGAIDAELFDVISGFEAYRK